MADAAGDGRHETPSALRSSYLVTTPMRFDQGFEERPFCRRARWITGHALRAASGQDSVDADCWTV
jgi:hypothetical protein